LNALTVFRGERGTTRKSALPTRKISAPMKGDLRGRPLHTTSAGRGPPRHPARVGAPRTTPGAAGRPPSTGHLPAWRRTAGLTGRLRPGVQPDRRQVTLADGGEGRRLPAGPAPYLCLARKTRFRAQRGILRRPNGGLGRFSAHGSELASTGDTGSFMALSTRPTSRMVVKVLRRGAIQRHSVVCGSSTARPDQPCVQHDDHRPGDRAGQGLRESGRQVRQRRRHQPDFGTSACVRRRPLKPRRRGLTRLSPPMEACAGGPASLCSGAPSASRSPLLEEFSGKAGRGRRCRFSDDPAYSGSPRRDSTSR